MTIKQKIVGESLGSALQVAALCLRSAAGALMNRRPRLSFKVKMSAVVLVPLVTMILFGLHETMERYQLAEELAGVRRLTGLSVKVGALVHELQRERGHSAGFLGSNGTRFEKELTAQRLMTDASQAELSAYLAGPLASKQGLDQHCRDHLAWAMGQIGRLAVIRKSVSGQSISPAEMVAYFTDTNSAFLDAVTAMPGLTQDSNISSALSSYADFVRIKELTGVERAVLTNTFARDSFADGMFVRLASLLGERAAYERAFLSCATPKEVDFYHQTVLGPDVDEVTQLEHMAMSTSSRGGFGVSSTRWFDAMTAKIDLMKRVEDEIRTDLEAQADSKIGAAKVARNLFALLTLAVMGVSICLAVWLTWAILGPVGSLSRTAQRVSADRDYSARAKKACDDELGTLVDCFNTMLEQIQQREHQLHQSKEIAECASRKLQESNATLEQRVLDRTAELETTHATLVDTARQAGMAEVAIGVLHNIGNVLNSVNVSASMVDGKVRRSKASSLEKVVALLKEHEAELGQFMERDGKGREVLDYLEKLSQAIALEQKDVLAELQVLSKNVEHVKEIVNTQQSYATGVALVESLDIHDLLEDALRINQAALGRHEVNIVRQFAAAQFVHGDKHKILQILVNLLTNAKQAMIASETKILTLSTETGPAGEVRVSIGDTGCGIAPENITRVFSHGFTTKKEGHGFGLHSSVLAAKEMKGDLTVHSDGPGRGTTFVLELPAVLPQALAA